MEEINTELQGEEAEKVLNVVNDYKDLVAKNMHQVGCTNLAEMSINMKDSIPINRRPHRVPYPERKQIQSMVQDLKETGMIEDSDLPFSSPVFLVKKKTGDV